jgi:hypothetical protein
VRWLAAGVAQSGVWARLTRLDLLVLLVIVGFYLGTRLVALTEYPIYFFCDEAIHGPIAQELLDNGLRDPDGVLLPAYFRNVLKYSLSASVYVQALAVWLLGASPEVLRGTSVLVGALAVVGVALAMRLGFNARLWWVAPLALTAMPAWFLHSRTAFETAMMVGFFGAFVLTYLLYRQHSPWWAPLTVLLGAATFYSYTNGQGVMAVCTVGLLISDARYHLEVLRSRRRVVAVVAVLIVLLAGPYVRFRFILHPEMVGDHLKDLNSYWVSDLPVSEKLERYLTTYTRSVDPRYWFFEDTDELVRHRMRGYGHLPVWLLPPVLLGVAVSLWRWRSSRHRLVLIAVLAAPFSAAVVDLRITRVLAMVVPAAMLAAIGLEQAHQWLQRVRPLRVVIPSAAAVMLTGGATFLTFDALTNGALWYRDYGLYGMQYGAIQVFDAVAEELDSSPSRRLMISHTWANNPKAFVDLFLSERQKRRVRLFSISALLDDLRRIPEDVLWVVPVGTLREGLESGKLEAGMPARTLLYPDGRPGFVLVPLRYTEAAPELFAAEAAARRQVVETVTVVDGVETTVEHSVLDIGRIDAVFDGDPETLARTKDAEPCIIELAFPTPRTVEAVRLLLWDKYYEILIEATPAEGGGDAVETFERFRDLGFKPTVEVALPEPVEAKKLRVEITKWGDRHVHVRELVVLP